MLQSNLWFNVRLKDAVRLILKKHRDLVPAIFEDKAGFVIASIKEADMQKVLAGINRGVAINSSGKAICTVTDTTIVLPVTTIDVL